MHESQLPGEYTTRLAEMKRSRKHRQTEQDSCWFQDWPNYNCFDVRNRKHLHHPDMIFRVQMGKVKGLIWVKFRTRKNMQCIRNKSWKTQCHCARLCDCFVTLGVCSYFFVSIFGRIASFCGHFGPLILCGCSLVDLQLFCISVVVLRLFTCLTVVVLYLCVVVLLLF